MANKSSPGLTNPHEESQLINISIQQKNAIRYIVAGLSDSEVAEKIGVTRETINRWRLHHPGFQAELNQWKKAVWEEDQDALRALVSKSLDIIKKVIDDDKSPQQVKVALEIIKRMDLPKDWLERYGMTDPEEIIDELSSRDSTLEMFDKIFYSSENRAFVIKSLTEKLKNEELRQERENSTP
jgi:hypothetical protein